MSPDEVACLPSGAGDSESLSSLYNTSSSGVSPVVSTCTIRCTCSSATTAKTSNLKRYIVKVCADTQQLELLDLLRALTNIIARLIIFVCFDAWQEEIE